MQICSNNIIVYSFKDNVVEQLKSSPAPPPPPPPKVALTTSSGGSIGRKIVLLN